MIFGKVKQVFTPSDVFLNMNTLRYDDDDCDDADDDDDDDDDG